MIEEIVQRISSRLLSKLPIDYGDIVGMEAHLEVLSPLLDMDSTIAKYLYELLKPRFSPHHCFMENVAELCGKHGLMYLQHQLLSNVFGEENMKLGTVERGRKQLEVRLRHVKVLLVLDDVDDEKQLRSIAKDVKWFGPGSRIIITTRDKSLLNSCRVYDIQYLDDDKALQLFQQIAFQGDKSPSSDYYKELSRRVSRLAQGLPLALQAFGFYLQKKPLLEWEDALSSYEKATYENIRRILEISYDRLDELSKSAFLHVTCLFNGDPVWYINTLLDHGEVGIKVLAEKCFIDVSPDGVIAMHCLLEEKGRETVRLDQQQILRNHHNIYRVLAEKVDTTRTEGIVLDVNEMPDVHIVWELFKSMENLKFLKIYNYNRHKGLYSRRGRNVKGILLPCKLRLLHWHAYPFTSLPSFAHPDCLVELNLCHSKLITLWTGTPPKLSHLKRLYLTGSKDLKELPDLQEAVHLEELMLGGCISLTQIPDMQKIDMSNWDELKNARIIIEESEATFPLGRSLCVRAVRVDFLDAERLVKEPPGISLTDFAVNGNFEIKSKLFGGFAEHLCFVTEQHITLPLMMLKQKTSSYGFKSLDIVRFNCNKDSGSFKCCSFLDFPWLKELSLINLNMEEISR